MRVVASTGQVFDDTWAFDGASWTQLQVIGPSGRAGAVMVPLNGKLVLFGGQDPPNGFMGDTWTFDGTEWTPLNITGPPAQADGLAAALGGQVIFFGAMDGYNLPWMFTWAFDGSSWFQVDVPGPFFDYNVPSMVTLDRP
jgi:Galactose oxidase, central domain